MSIRLEEQTEFWGKPGVCAVVVVYEDAPARDLAIQLCGSLEQSFVGDLEFDFAWWRFDYLSDPRIIHDAIETAVKADLILVAIHRAKSIPSDVQAWFEGWVPRRKPAEGALAVLQTALPAEEPVTLDDSYLRLAAERGDLDYLLLPGPGTAPPGVDRLRKDQVLSDSTEWHQSPDRRYHSSGWGINE